MEKEDVPAQVIEDYKKAEILRKSMAVVRIHAKRMQEIRQSPQRYEKVKGKINTKNPFAINISSITAASKRSTMNITGISPDYKLVNSTIREENTVNMQNRPFSKSRTNANDKQAPADQNEDWYRPDLGDVSNVTLTKVNREKIEMRDR